MYNLSWLLEIGSEILQLAAPSSVILLVLSKWWEDKMEFGRVREMLFDEMAANETIIKDNLDMIRKGEKGLKEGGGHGHVSPLQRLSYSGWTLLLASGKLSKFSGKNSGKEIRFSIRELYTHIILIDQQMDSRELILYGPLRVQITTNSKGRPFSWADKELDIVDKAIEGNLCELKKKISEIKKELNFTH